VLFFDGALGLLAVGVWIFCIIDVITTPEGESRNLPKLAWLFIVIILVDIGSIAWLVAGRDWNKQPAQRLSRDGNRQFAPRLGRSAAARRPTNPDDDEEFLATLRARAEEQRRRARETQQPDDEPHNGPDPSG
jgi:hypothetical protein